MTTRYLTWKNNEWKLSLEPDINNQVTLRGATDNRLELRKSDNLSQFADIQLDDLICQTIELNDRVLLSSSTTNLLEVRELSNPANYANLYGDSIGGNSLFGLDSISLGDDTTRSPLIWNFGTGTNNTQLLPAETVTGSRVITFPDASGTVSLLDGTGKISGDQIGSGFADIPAGQEVYYLLDATRTWQDRSILKLPEKASAPVAAADHGVLYASDENGITVINYTAPDGFIARPLRDLVIVVRNNTGATLTKGSVVYVNGVHSGTGFIPTVALASASYSATPLLPAIGVVAADIPNNSYGRVVTEGRVDGINTLSSGAIDGQRVLVGTTPGTFTATVPTLPNFTQRLGIVLRSHASQGSILIDPQSVITGSQGSSSNTFSIGDGLDTTKTLRFLADFQTNLTANASANRTLLLPDKDGTIATLGDTGVIQSKTIVFTSQVSTTSSTFVTTGFSIALDNNLRSTSSKVRVRFGGFGGGNDSATIATSLRRGATDLRPVGAAGMSAASFTGANIGRFLQFNIGFEFVDTAHGSVTPQTYEVFFSSQNASLPVYIGRRGADAGVAVISTLTVEELL